MPSIHKNPSPASLAATKFNLTAPTAVTTAGTPEITKPRSNFPEPLPQRPQILSFLALHAASI